jgi:TatD DNase family protein
VELVDIGVNLTHRSFDRDRDDVLDRALKAGISKMIVTGTRPKVSEEAANLARKYPNRLYATAGVHPHNAREFAAPTAKLLKDLAGRPEVVAIGECGLDFNRDFSPRIQQERAFEAHLELASETALPLFLHERDAHSRFVSILSARGSGAPPAVVHCFTGSAKELETYLNLGLFIGITGWICDERRGLHLRELVKRIPLQRLMLETDAPFLIPRTPTSKPMHGRNEPSLLREVLRTTATSMRISEQELAAATTRTAREFFGLR